jgi:prolyl-tRNA synthetase
MAKQPVLTPQADDFPRWYQDVVAKAELAENGPVRGTMVIRPYGYSIWERIQAELDERIKAQGAENAYFPLFIPDSYFRKEAEHVEGFSPELAVVTHAGGKELEEPIAIRPTSETVMGTYFAKWIQSYRDLPLRINQWSNVVRWELRPRLFLRTSEFLWQEGHTCHSDEAGARDYSIAILNDVYREMMVDVMGVPVLTGRKTAAERFAGAINTFACEAMMRDGKALQMGTSHELGQGFAKVFDIKYLSSEGNQEYVWQTSWGASTRLVGGLIMTHGDDAGLRIPPRLAPIQVVVVAIRDDGATVERSRLMAEELRAAGHRVRWDDRVETSFGRRATEWELKGIPIRIEVGPRDLAQEEVTLVRRDTGDKAQVPVTGVRQAVADVMPQIQEQLMAEATERQERATVDVDTVEEAAEAARSGFARIPWTTLGVEGETRLAADAITVRCLVNADGSLPVDGDETDLLAVVGRSY